MSLPPTLISKIREGNAILFLGSGALVGCHLPRGNVPLGEDLKNLLCDRFLDDDYKGESLAHVAAIAISQRSLAEVQDYIAGLFSGIEPADFHLRIPKHAWRGVFTTNYDRLLEICYEQADAPIQELVTLISNQDSIDATRQSNNKIPFVKLHGCVTRTHDENLPLILTVDQYNDSLSNRKRLFDHLFELAYENSIVFIGHSLQDANLRSVLMRLQRESPNGQRHYLLKPGIKEAEVEFWGQKKVTGVNATFKEFLDELDVEVSENARALALARPARVHPIQSLFEVHREPSHELLAFLTNDAELVCKDLTYQEYSPRKFYRGADLGWYPFAASLAISRSVERQLSEEIFLKPDVERVSDAELYVLKGEAGSGKTVVLRKLAWDSMTIGFGVCLWVKPNAAVDLDLIEEIANKTGERVFLFWDDAAINRVELQRFYIKARRRHVNVTIVTAERLNEWNTKCDELDELISNEFQLRYLSEREIEELLEKLEQYSCLGPNLTPKTFEERKDELKEKHGRQLLVALHEATMGEPFEDIVFSEYSNIIPEAAQQIYLTVCTLNRMRVPVRAGLISRIHDITFDDFRSAFYKPLEQVVLSSLVGESDVHYKARHPEIAEIVFYRALEDHQERYNEYVRILSKLNIAYESDRSSFRSLIRAHSLLELFPSHQDIVSLYALAKEKFDDDPYLLQQIANYERLRENGSLEKAVEILGDARRVAPNDQSILHSLAVVWRDMARVTDDRYKRMRCRHESRAYLDEASRKWGITGYIANTKIDLALDNLEDTLSDSASTPRVITDAVSRIEAEITECKRQFSSQGIVHKLEARLASMMNDNEGVVLALQKSFEENNRDPATGIRVAALHRDAGNPEEALQILRQALDGKRSDHKLNFAYAELLRSQEKAEPEELSYYYRRSYTPNDKTYAAQFWYARYASVSASAEDRAKADEIFLYLRNARLPHQDRVTIRDMDGGLDSPVSRYGVVKAKKNAYCFVTVDGSGKDLFCPAASVEDDLWEALEEGDRLRFNIGYSYSGLVGCNLVPT